MGRWCAAALGDTCLFQVSGGELQHAFPLSDVSAFNDTPLLLGSSDTDTTGITSRVSLTSGAVVPGDQLYVCTDALAAWFLRQHADGHRPWEVLDALDEAEFPSWLQAARADSQLRNDDVTLVHIGFGDST